VGGEGLGTPTNCITSGRGGDARRLFIETCGQKEGALRKTCLLRGQDIEVSRGDKTWRSSYGYVEQSTIATERKKKKRGGETRASIKEAPLPSADGTIIKNRRACGVGWHRNFPEERRRGAFVRWK